jgi:site-specific recombinase XerD
MASKSSVRLKREMALTTLGMLIDFYGADMRLKNRTRDSINTNLSHLRRFAAHAGGLDVKVSELTADTARAYVESLQSRQSKWENHPTRPPENKPLSPYTIRKTVKILRGFGAWMARDGTDNPFKELEIPTVPKTLVDTLTTDEVEKILACINPSTLNGARNYAMLLLMLDAGPRISEVTDLRMIDLNLQDREAKLMGKGRKERRMPFGQKTTRALMR